MARRRSGRRNAALLSGWLFADLLLVLFLIAMVSVPPHVATPAAKPTPTRSATRSPSPSPSPSGSPRPRGLDPNYLALNVPVAPSVVRAGGYAQFQANLDQQLSARNPGHRLVGLILVFAWGPDDQSDQNIAHQTSDDVVSWLTKHDSAFSAAIGLGYWGAAQDTFDVKIFFLNS